MVSNVCLNSVVKGEKFVGSLLSRMSPKIGNPAGLKYIPEKNNYISRVLNTKTGMQETITFNELPNEIVPSEVYRITAYNETGKDIGCASYKLLQRKNRPDSLYIKYFGTSNEYKGIGREIIHKLVQLSNQMGMNGKITLQACTGEVPFRYPGFMKKCNVSAAIKYKKMGFIAEDRVIDKRISDEILKGGNGFLSKRDMFNGTKMSLSDEAIQKYLSLNYIC